MTDYADLTRFIAERIVSNPSAVTVEARPRGRSTIVTLHVAEDDMGKLIGKTGRNIEAVRAVVRAAGLRHHAARAGGVERPAVTTGRPLAPAKLRAAQVLRAHGVRGEVRVEPIGGDPDRFTPGTRLETEDGARALTVRTARRRSRQRGAAQLRRGHAHRQRQRCSEACTSASTSTPRARSQTMNGSSGSSSDSALCDTSGANVGVVDDVEAGVGNDVLVIRDGATVHRLPMARDYVTSVDVAGGTVTVTPWAEETV